MWRIVYSKQAQKDAKRIGQVGLKSKAEIILDIIQKNPYDMAHNFEKLRGDYAGLYSRRITIKHRLVYEIFDEMKLIRIIRMWTHYE